MLEPLDKNNFRDHLTAFADGELDAAQAAAVWAYFADHPDDPGIRWLANQKQLTLAARRTLNVPVPTDLRDRVAALVSNEPPASLPIVAARRTWPRRVGYAFALAAAMAIGVTVSSYSGRSGGPVNVVPPDLIRTVSRAHAGCSRLPEQLHNARFNEVDSNLAGLTRTDLGGSVDAPDLSTVGFRFVGADKCLGAKVETVHLLYRSARPSDLAAISLFVQIDAGQFPALKPRHVYRVSSPTSPFPMLAWRSGQVIYFLLADNDRTESNVLQTLHPMPADAIITVAE